MSNTATKKVVTDITEGKKNLSQDLEICGAKENNLKNVSLSIPHDTFTVVTGLSGSGKSSLAFDTVYAEGQRRYVETFSSYTRQFFDRVKKPSVDRLENVRPAIAIQQKSKITGSRSTVGSLTNINDYLKVIWTALSSPYCPETKEKLVAWTTSLVIEQITKLFKESQEIKSVLIAAKYKVNLKHIEAEIDRLKTLGFSRAWDYENNQPVMVEDYNRKKITAKNPTITIVLDRLRSATSITQATGRSIDQAFQLAESEVTLIYEENKKFHERNFCKDFKSQKTGQIIPKPKSYLFSYNHPLGACQMCRGFGHTLIISKEKVIPDISKSLKDHAIACWSGPSAEWEYKSLLDYCIKEKIPLDSPWFKLSKTQQEKIFNHKEKDFWGVNHWFKWLETKTYKMHVRVFLSRYRTPMICPDCNGTRLKNDALSFLINDKNIAQVFSMPIDDLLDWFKKLYKDTSSNKYIFPSVKDPLNNIVSRLQYLVNLGLSYLTLDRQAKTLSGGETQRVNLTTALGSDLVSTQFVLDEPSVGLHPKDSDRLLTAIKALSLAGNSLLVVEHDPDVICQAENIIEIGPESGANGGNIVYSGAAKNWKGISAKPRLRKITLQNTFKNFLEINNASARNLQNINVKIPLNALTCFTGLSGSGKSTLAHEVITNAWRAFKGEQEKPEYVKSVEGFKNISDLVVVDQSALSKTPRATIGTYTKIWDVVRDLFAATDQAKALGFSKSTFSFNVVGGRCASCEGAGFVKEDMQFLSDVLVPCETCLQKRFQPQVLAITYESKNISDFLNMTIDEAYLFFKNKNQNVESSLDLLKKLGLGSLTLGHPLSELSGGEAQRLKLVPYLQIKNSGNVLFIFDEPTTGLHIKDVENLVMLFDKIVSDGHSVVCIEHNLSVIQNCDWIVDLGPEGGKNGGDVVHSGSYDQLVKNSYNLSPHSSTLRYLKDYQKKIKNVWKATSSSKIKSIVAKDLIITGAREHNLKNITIKIPTDKIVALTGVSGSGKSTVAKDIVYAEGQRRYLDCLSPYARQFIKELAKPDIDNIFNVRPTICVYQHTFQPSALSTVATMSEVYNYLRLLYSKTGDQFCPDHPTEIIKPLSAKEIAEQIVKIKSSAIRILAPVIKAKKGNHKAVFERALDSEILEVRVDQKLVKSSYFLDQPLAKTKPHTIEYVIAKFNPSTINREILQETVENALVLGTGSLLVLLDDDTEFLYSANRSCSVCQRGFLKVDPEDLSFNSKRGRCESCEGTGISEDQNICSDCSGSRLSEIGRNVRINKLNIHQACNQTAPELLSFLKAHQKLIQISNRSKEIATPVLFELYEKLTTLIELGLDYFNLARSCKTLSGGELQRLRLASSMGSDLSGVCYIFDEPSAGLHPQDNRLVLKKLKTLKERNNSVIIIEHDIESILACEYILDIGPDAGVDGGEVVYSGEVKKYVGADSPTGKALVQKAPSFSDVKKFNNYIHVDKASKFTIKNLSTKIPLNSFVTVGGVSGSGKSSLVNGIVVDSLLNKKKNVTPSIAVDKIIYLDQKPIGSTSRSTPASYLGIWDEIRKIFASTLEARSQGWNAGHFSYNSGTGRCSECKGAGVLTLEMNFLANAKVICEACGGTRYGDDVMIVHYQGKSISQVLNLTFDEARQLFANHRKIHPILKLACDLGLGYLKLGQASNTLSGGEAQRIKIVSELSSAMRGHTLYILDEPTLGLHRSDIFRLINALRALVERGASVIVIEHDLDTIISSDYFIEMGPGAGEYGGNIIFEGTPKECAAKKTPWGKILSNSSM